MPKNLRKIAADFDLVMKLYLKIQESVADHSPCERFVDTPIRRLKRLNCPMYFRRMMKCHGF
jgi:hypothetical protein